MKSLRFWLQILSVSFISLLFRCLIPPNPQYIAGHDDQLMVKMARNILDTGWIGEYSDLGHLVLSKPAGYPMFLAHSSFFPFAPTVTVHILLLTGFVVFIREMVILGMSERLAVFLFGVFAFHPAWFNEPMSQIYRDGFLASLSALFIGLLMWWKRGLENQSTEESKKSRKVKLGLVSVALGITIGFFVISKPSWHFLLVIFTVIFIGNLWSANIIRLKGGKFRPIIVFTALIVLGTAIPISYVVSQNHKYFGILSIDNFSQGQFPEAMKWIYGVEDKLNRPYIDVTREMRDEIYSVSPTMLELKQFLELPDGIDWRSQPCNYELAVCDESGAWFPWDIRDAVEKSGLGNSAQEFNETFGRISSEIRTACAQKQIKCESKGLAPGLDSLDSLSPKVVFDAIAMGYDKLLDPNVGFKPRSQATQVSEEILLMWNSTVKGLPAFQEATTYQSESESLGSVRKLNGKLYSLMFPVLLLFAFGSLIYHSQRKFWDKHITLIIATAGIFLGVATFVLQIALLQASSGFYLTHGGDLYLLPMIPLVIAMISMGLKIFHDSYEENKSKFKSCSKTASSDS